MFDAAPLFSSSKPLTLVGGGFVSHRLLDEARRYAPDLIAVDGGANRCVRFGAQPRFIVGDLDSISKGALRTFAKVPRQASADQETTDFEKALRSISAPLLFGVGFLGGRIDHELATMNALARYAPRCVLIGARDVVFRAPLKMTLHMRSGDRLSLFPMGDVSGASRGLAWPIDGLRFAPGMRIGTSNRVTGDGRVELEFSQRHMLCIVARTRLDRVCAALNEGDFVE